MRRSLLLALVLLSPAAILAGQRAGLGPTPGADPAQTRVRAGVAKLYDASRLHRVDVVMSAEDANRIVRRTEERVRATFTFDGLTLKDVGVRQAGGMYHPYVSIPNKPSLSVKFDEFVKGQRLFDLDKVVLKNQSDDSGLVNEHVAYEIFRRAGIAAPMTAFAEVTINGIDNGIYLLREPIDKEFLVRNFGKGFETGNLYEIENVREFVTDPNYPALDDEGKNGRNRQDLVTFAAAIRNTTPASFVTDLAKHLDIDRFITYIAAEMATWHWDGLAYRNNNMYLYAHPRDGRFLFIPYGTDQTFGGTSGFRGWDSEVPRSALVRAMLTLPELAARYRAEIMRIGREPVWNRQVLLDRVNQVGRVLQAAGSSGRTARDVAGFARYRPRIEALIQNGGRCSSDASVNDRSCR